MFKKIKNIILNPFLIKKYFYAKQNIIDFKKNKSFIDSFYPFESIQEILSKENHHINEFNSWHYPLIISIIKSNKLESILEIGTYTGVFAAFLSKVFPALKITTIDLPTSSVDFINSYDRKNVINNFISKRNSLLKDFKNIDFLEFDSFFLLDRFYKKKQFDLIWVDGDHKNPQVSFDILSSLKLIRNNGWVIIDDIVIDNFQNEYVDGDSFKTLKELKRRNIIELSLILKRVTVENALKKKYIAVIKLLHV